MRHISRHRVLDILTNVLKEPERHGDRFLVQIVKNAKGKAIPIHLIHGMARDLYEIPLYYFIDCIQSSSRFELNSNKTSVRFSSLPIETDSRGYLDQKTMTEDKQLPTDEHYTFLSKILTKDLQPKQAVLPVIFNNGRFYEDIAPEDYNERYQSFISVPDYKKENMEPLGVREKPEVYTGVCFNCGISGHAVSECSQPIDRTAIRKRRGELRADKRYFDVTDPEKPSGDPRMYATSDGKRPYYESIYQYPSGYSRQDRRSRSDQLSPDIHLFNLLGTQDAKSEKPDPERHDTSGHVQPRFASFDPDSQQGMTQNNQYQMPNYTFDSHFQHAYQPSFIEDSNNAYPIQNMHLPQIPLYTLDFQQNDIQRTVIQQTVPEKNQVLDTSFTEDVDMDISSDEE